MGLRVLEFSLDDSPDGSLDDYHSHFGVYEFGLCLNHVAVKGQRNNWVETEGLSSLERLACSNQSGKEPTLCHWHCDTLR